MKRSRITDKDTTTTNNTCSTSAAAVSSSTVFRTFRFSYWILFICVIYIQGCGAIQCFCTSKDCKDPLCESHWCLVGFKSDVELVQTCATETAKALLNCARKLNEWEEVCSCTEDYCNTFSFMRERLRKYDDVRTGNPEIPNELEGLDTSNLEDKDARRGKKNSVNKQLVVLLVVVPLGIGAVTVCLVFLNYHCKMC